MLERNSYNPSRNNGLGLARYILKELNNNRILHINLGSKQFDNNKKFVHSIQEFLKDMKWLSLDKYGEYKITEAGRKNSLVNLKF
ncbi:MAG TPA: hypothetical protein VIY98_07760 [Nitrososphaeraceae archaeon]